MNRQQKKKFDKPLDTSEKEVYTHTIGDKLVKVVNSMSKYVTCREANIKPEFSDLEKQYPYELDYILVEWTGKPKKTYYEGSDIEIMTVYSKNWCVVSEDTGEGFNGYICRDWDTAKALREKLKEG